MDPDGSFGRGLDEILKTGSETLATDRRVVHERAENFLMGFLASIGYSICTMSFTMVSKFRRSNAPCTQPGADGFRSIRRAGTW